jgi:type III secretion protein V
MRELIIPGFILMIIGGMLFPLPPFAIDFFLIGSLVFSFLLLLVTVRISEPLRLSSFPTILLLVTLFRLSLNVATTRAILGSGEAGGVIATFGASVVGESLVVGLVVFIIVTIVQFIVVAKGAERVAEVSARFALDAMPGRQMSIDADVRSGLLALSEAKGRRSDLQAESKLYGALDGAMKFVKGDAIAGILITSINIVGGFLTGVFLHGLSLNESISQYVLLSVGDGLISQIPALLNALSAGIIVTRVVRGDDRSLANEIPEQVASLPNFGVIALIISLGLSALFGIPALIFSVIPITLLILAYRRRRKAAKIVHEEVVNFLPRLPDPLNLIIDCKVFTDKILTTKSLTNVVERFRSECQLRTGIILAIPQARLSDENNEEGLNNYKVKLELFGEESGEIILSEEGAKEELHNFLLKNFLENKVLFINDTQTRKLLEFCESFVPEPAASLLSTGRISLTQVTEVIRALVKEDISIRNLPVIFQAIAENVPKVGVGRVLLEEVRISLSKSIQSTLSLQGETLLCAVLDTELDLEIGEAERRGEDSLVTLLSISDSLVSLPVNLPLITSRAARMRLREFFEARRIQQKVVAYEEVNTLNLQSDVIIQKLPSPLKLVGGPNYREAA